MTHNISKTWAWGMFVIAAAFYGYEYLLRVVPSIMVPDLISKFKVSANQIGLLSAFYYYTYTPLQLFAGTIVDHYGARLILTLSAITCVIGTYLFGLTDSLVLATIGRASIGLGSAFAFIGAMRICSDWLPEDMFATLAGVTTTIGMLGAISGELLLSDMKAAIGIDNTFIVCLVFGTILSVLLGIFVRTKQLITVKTGSAQIKSLLRHMLFLIRKPVFWNISIAGLCIFMPTTIFASLWAVKFLKDVYQIDNGALYSSMIFLGWAVGGPIVGLIKKNYQVRDKYLLATGAVGACIAAIMTIYLPEFSKPYLTQLMFMFGLFSSAEVLVFDLNHILAGPALCGTSVALTNMVVMIGGFMQPIVGSLLDLHSNGTSYSYCDYKIALAIIPLSFAIGFVLSLLLPEHKIIPPDTIPE